MLRVVPGRRSFGFRRLECVLSVNRISENPFGTVSMGTKTCIRSLQWRTGNHRESEGKNSASDVNGVYSVFRFQAGSASRRFVWSGGPSRFPLNVSERIAKTVTGITCSLHDHSSKVGKCTPISQPRSSVDANSPNRVSSSIAASGSELRSDGRQLGSYNFGDVRHRYDYSRR
jgi:hypothetical protein